MDFFLNTTNNYHINDLNSLGWELTVCNALYPSQSPCRKALQSNESFGVQLYRYLEKQIPLDNISSILEIGGGMGYLMLDFLSLKPTLQATMLDISPYLLARQRESLHGFSVQFLEKDALKMETNFLSHFDMVIMNENLGDLPTLAFNADGKDDPTTKLSCNKADHFIEKYQLSISSGESINIGAWEILEKLCQSKVKYIYISEHSCEAAAPDFLKSFLNFTLTGRPEKISLRGHDEYTIKFSCLQRIAETFNYIIRHGPMADFLKSNFDEKVNTILRLPSAYTDEQEIIRQFVYDIYKYEYLILIKGDE